MLVIFALKTLAYIDGLLLIGLLFFRWALAARYKTLVDGKVIALTLAVPAFLILVPKVEIGYAFLALAAMLAGTRAKLAGNYVLLLPMVPELSVEYSAAGFYVMRLSTTAAIGFGALLALMWTSRTTRMRLYQYDWAAALLVIIFTVMAGRGLPLNSYIRSFADILFTIGVPYIIVSRSIGTERDANIVLSRLFLAGTLASVIAIFEAGRHWALYEYIATHMAIDTKGLSVLNIRAGFMRSGGPLINSSSLGLFLAVLPAALWGVRSLFHTVGYRAVMAIIVVGLIATQSRGAWIGCGAGFCVLWAYRGLRARAVGALAGASLIYLIAGFILPENGRLAESLGRSGAAADTLDYRRLLFEEGLVQIRAHPVFGQSAADLRISMSELVQGQGIIDFVNTHLFVALGSGLVGFALWSLIWWIPIRASLKRGSPITRSPASAFQVVPETILVVSLVALTFTSTTNRALAWPVMALGMMGPFLALARQHVRRAPAEPASPSRKSDRDVVLETV
jgi:hypothetical protein